MMSVSKSFNILKIKTDKAINLDYKLRLNLYYNKFKI